MTGELLTAASRLVHQTVDSQCYGIVYGSHARNTAGTRSDLDLLIVGADELSPVKLSRLIDAVKDLHRRWGLQLDEEVSYDVKLYATASEVTSAVSLSGFAVTPSGDLSVPEVAATPEFLNSRPFKLRLILNALTSPRVFLGGNVDRYRRDQTAAERALSLLALSFLDGARIVGASQAVDALTTDASSATGKEFLGYTAGDTRTLYGLIQRAFAELIRKGALIRQDGAHFVQQHDVRRSLVAATAALPHSQ